MSIASTRTQASAVDDAARQGRALAVGILLVVIWGVGFSFQKVAYAGLGPGAFLFLRSVLMGLCSLMALRLLGRPFLPPLEAEDRARYYSAVAFGSVAHVLLVTYGVHWSTPFSAAVIMACGPVVTLVLLRLIEGTRLQPRQMGGVAIAMLGVLVFMADKLMHSDVQASLGDLALIGSTVVFSLYTIRLTPLVRRYGGIEMTCWTTLTATPLLMVLTVLPLLRLPLGEVRMDVWIGYLYTVLLSAFLGFVLWNWVNGVRGVARTAPLLYLVPPIAGLVGWLFLGETLGPWKLVGGAIALAGVALAQRDPAAARA